MIAAASPKLLSALRLAAGLILSVALLALAMQGVDLERAWSVLLSAQPAGLVAAVLSVLVTNGIKALRWRLFFRTRPRTPGFGTSLSATMAGQALNFALPFRIGDLARAYLIGAWEAESKSYALATIALEKVIDLTMLLALAIGVIPFVAVPAWFRASERGLFFSSGFLILIALLLFFQRMRLLVWLNRMVAWLPSPLQSPVISSGQVALSSLTALGDRYTLRRIGFWSVTGWIMAALTNQFVFWSLRLDLPFIAAIFLLVVLQAGVALPSSPGKVGVFQYLCILVLTGFGVDANVAFAYSWVLYIVVFAPIAVSGVLALWPRHGRLASTRTMSAPESRVDRFGSGGASS